MQKYENPILRENQSRSGQGGPQIAIKYKGRQGVSNFSSMKMSVPPRTKPENDTWYMNPRQPNWTPTVVRESDSMSAKAPVQAAQPTKRDEEYLRAAMKIGETPGYAPPPASTRVNPSPYKWSGWF